MSEVATDAEVAVLSVLREHRINCTGLGEVGCAGCRDAGWMTWHAYHTHLAILVTEAALREAKP